jgi:hypothetical protein
MFDTPESHIVKWSMPVDPNNFGEPLVQPEQEPNKCGCGANLYIDENGKPCSKVAKPEQEPVRWFQQFGDAPPKREWVGLSVEDQADILDRKWWNFEDEFDLEGFLRVTEAKLKEKNGG